MNNRNKLGRLWGWLTRAYHQEFEVTRPFEATEIISGSARSFRPGDIVYCDDDREGAEVTFRIDGGSFAVERGVSAASCRPRQPTTMPAA